MQHYSAGFCACGTKEEAEHIASVLVEEKNAACVTLLNGAVSVYRWKGKIVKGREIILLIKTVQEKQSACIAAVQEHHSYENPEIIFVDISGGSEEYLAWLGTCLK